MRRIILLAMVLLSLNLTADAQRKIQRKIIYRNSVRCLGVELDGSQTLRVEGYGRNRFDAREQAMKNAVWVVMFKGVRDGNGGCNTRPIITEERAHETYEDYFNIFFADGGEYLRYVSLRDTKKYSSRVNETSTGCGYEMTVRVRRAELKDRLKRDRILP